LVLLHGRYNNAMQSVSKYYVIVLVALKLLSAVDASARSSYQDDPEIPRDPGLIYDPRSRLFEEYRRTDRMNYLRGIAYECEKKGDFENALQAYNKAYSFDPHFFESNPERGFLLGKMNRWAEATRDFDKAIRDRWHTDLTIKVVEFILQQNPEVARHFENRLSIAFDNPLAIMTLSKICSATNRDAEAKKFAEQAYYVDHALGNETNRSGELLELLTHNKAPLPVPIKFAQDKFWNLIDATTNSDRPPVPSRIKQMLEAPQYLQSAWGQGNFKIESAFGSDLSTAPIRLASLKCDSECRTSGVEIKPNILSCCLQQEDVISYLRNHEMSFSVPDKVSEKKTEPPKIVARTEWGKITYTFDSKGFDSLKTVELDWNEPGPALMKPYVRVEPKRKEWTELVTEAKTLLKQRKFAKCRDRLSFAFGTWDTLGNEHKKQSEKRRNQYESLRNSFVELHEAWHKPAIAQYFKEVSYWQLRQQIGRVGSYPLEYEDFPTISEFRQQLWSISRKIMEEHIHVEISDSCRRDVEPGSVLYIVINQKLAADGTATKIHPFDGKLLDDLDFESQSKNQETKSFAATKSAIEQSLVEVEERKRREWQQVEKQEEARVKREEAERAAHPESYTYETRGTTGRHQKTSPTLPEGPPIPDSR
jgi:tetratricopeptide (TPR) repeat protein